MTITEINRKQYLKEHYKLRVANHRLSKSVEKIKILIKLSPSKEDFEFFFQSQNSNLSIDTFLQLGERLSLHLPQDKIRILQELNQGYLKWDGRETVFIQAFKVFIQGMENLEDDPDYMNKIASVAKDLREEKAFQEAIVELSKIVSISTLLKAAMSFNKACKKLETIRKNQLKILQNIFKITQI